MSITYTAGKLIRIPHRRRSDRIFIYSQKFSDMQLVVPPQTTLVNLHAEAVLAGLNIDVTHERENFSLCSDNDTNALTYSNTKIETHELVPALDKFEGNDPNAGLLMNEFYADREDLTENEKRSFLTDRRQKQLSFAMAYRIFDQGSKPGTSKSAPNKYTSGRVYKMTTDLGPFRPQ